MNDARSSTRSRTDRPHAWTDTAEAHRTRGEARRRTARIMIVDDHVPNLTLLRSVLTRAGFGEVIAIEDPRVSVDSIEARPPDVILLDYHMPHLDGLDVLSALRDAVDPDVYLPIVLTTSDDDLRLHRAAMRMGVSGNTVQIIQLFYGKTEIAFILYP